MVAELIFGVRLREAAHSLPGTIMAGFEPFAALGPRPEVAARICEPPYDVMSAEEARQMAAGNPLSFLHVSRPEIDLPQGTDPHAPEVYVAARRNFGQLCEKGWLVRDPVPAFHLYRQAQGGHAQTGIVGLASCEEYVCQVVKRHELTRPEKEEDRRRHIEALEAQTGPAFLVHAADVRLAHRVKAWTHEAPALDFTASDGVRHTAWRLADPEAVKAIRGAFRAMSALYIADGHHRTAAAVRVWQDRSGRGGSAHFLAVAFPHDAVRILPYHRVVRDLGGLSEGDFEARLSAVFETLPEPAAVPTARHEVGFYRGGRWRRLRFRAEVIAGADPAERLDVALLQGHVLGPVLGISDPRTSPRLEFVGGIRGTSVLEKAVDGAEAACAFSMYPTGIEELMAIADAGGLLPPKSTWFEPKLRDGMFSHLLG